MVLTLANDYSQIVEPACSRRAACSGRHSRPIGELWSPPDANVAKLCSSVTESVAKISWSVCPRLLKSLGRLLRPVCRMSRSDLCNTTKCTQIRSYGWDGEY